MRTHPLVGDCVVVGERRPYLIALIALDPEALARLATKGVAAEDIVNSEEVRDTLAKHVEVVNKDLAQVETIKKFAVLPPFSLEKGEGAFC
jgi:long-chain acyl-CoA synthetase